MISFLYATVFTVRKRREREREKINRGASVETRCVLFIPRAVTVAFCIICNSSFSVGSGGRTSVVEHQQIKKHKAAIVGRAGVPSVSTFFKRVAPSQTEFELAVQEGVFAYHTISHNHSFRSMDCTASLNRKLYEPKCSCARSEAIVQGVSVAVCHKCICTLGHDTPKLRSGADKVCVCVH